ncbi:thioredoxin domain-containing protein [Patulibacter sp.]|uniref:DsbA family protein n=1 Tax=Patulibacter sp. TaxID=1912859 RepID=UPI002726FFE4|nr:thioredoxin domain-containing protein [Patulibacter sp.]MDO9407521.1 thioredoxin domain-containing protein [Patulibacter sp.]
MSGSAERDRLRRAREEREAQERSATDRRRRLRALGATAGVVVLLVAAVVAFGAFKGDPADDGSRTEVDGVGVRGVAETTALLRGLRQDGTTLGRRDAPVTILEVADLKCPACKAHEIETQPAIVDRLVRTGRANLRMELVNFRDAPAGTTDGEGARRAAYALAATDRFWTFAHLAFWNQGSELDAWASEPVLRAIAGAAPGLEPDDVDVRETPASRSGIAAAERLAAALRTDATPSVYVVPRGSATGARVEDPGDVDALDRAVRQAAAKAR